MVKGKTKGGYFLIYCIVIDFKCAGNNLEIVFTEVFTASYHILWVS